MYKHINQIFTFKHLKSIQFRLLKRSGSNIGKSQGYCRNVWGSLLTNVLQ